MIISLILSHVSKVRGRHPVFTWTQYVNGMCQDGKMFTVIPLSKVLVDKNNGVCCLMKEKEGTMKRSCFYGELSHFLNCALIVSPRDKMLDMRRKAGPYKIQRFIFYIG